MLTDPLIRPGGNDYKGCFLLCASYIPEEINGLSGVDRVSGAIPIGLKPNDQQYDRCSYKVVCKPGYVLTHSNYIDVGDPSPCKAVEDNSAFAVTLSGMTANSNFSFQMSAAGDFEIDWGDGGAVQTVTKTSATNETYSHTYSAAGNYAVKLAGLATGYNSGESVAAVSFENSVNKNKITALSGSLGAIFPILNNTATGKPRFVKTFYKLNGITSIPGGLFSGIQGAPASYMFDSTFACDITVPDAWDRSWRTNSNLSGEIPGDLFSGLQGAPAPYMFKSTFDGCMKLTGIGGPLFAGIRGAPAEGMYRETFNLCRGLTGIGPDGTGTIPRGLFGHFDNGAPAPHMFAATFFGCANLCGEIPGNLFQGMKGRPARAMFFETFSGSFKPHAPIASGHACYGLPIVDYISTPKIPCYNNIGDGLFDGIEGIEDVVQCNTSGSSRNFVACNGPGWTDPTRVAPEMFYGTFNNAQLCGDGPKSDGMYIWEKFPGNCGNTYRGPITCFLGMSTMANIFVKTSGRPEDNVPGKCECHADGTKTPCSRLPGDGSSGGIYGHTSNLGVTCPSSDTNSVGN